MMRMDDDYLDELREEWEEAKALADRVAAAYGVMEDGSPGQDAPPSRPLTLDALREIQDARQYEVEALQRYLAAGGTE